MKYEVKGVWYRVCSSCKNHKIINEENFAFRFAKDKCDSENISDYHSICRICKNIKKQVKRRVDKTRLEKERIYKKAYYEKNGRERMKKYRDENREKMRKYWRERNRIRREKARLLKIKELRKNTAYLQK